MQTATASRDSEANYRAIFDAANDAIFVHDAATGAILDVNRRMSEMYGCTREEALSLTVEDLSAGVSPYTQERALKLVQKAVAGSPQLFEWLAKDRAGRLFWAEVNLRCVVLGDRARLLAIVRDISDRKIAERQIRESHESQKTLNALLRLALEDMKLEDLLQRALALVLHSTWPVTLGVGAVFLVDDETGGLVLKAHHGLDVETSPYGHYCIPISAGKAVLGVLKVYWAEGHLQDPREGEFFGAFASTLAGIIVRKNGEQKWRAADEQLREQATLVKLGEMAAVVAHEVRNPLAGVRGAIQVIGGRLPEAAEDASLIKEIVARLDALDELMKDLLLFARPPQMRPASVDVLALVNETSALLSQDPTARDVRFEIEGSSSAVLVDPQLLQIVLLNLFLNAAHAMQGRGVIRTLVAVSDRTCRIAVADSGPGIPREIRDKVFAPFFTTKARGTGLGLATARRLIDNHQGRISIDCPASGGTTVVIELPRGNCEPAEAAQTALPAMTSGGIAATALRQVSAN